MKYLAFLFVVLLSLLSGCKAADECSDESFLNNPKPSQITKCLKTVDRWMEYSEPTFRALESMANLHINVVPSKGFPRVANPSIKQRIASARNIQFGSDLEFHKSMDEIIRSYDDCDTFYVAPEPYYQYVTLRPLPIKIVGSSNLIPKVVVSNISDTLATSYQSIYGKDLRSYVNRTVSYIGGIDALTYVLQNTRVGCGDNSTTLAVVASNPSSWNLLLWSDTPSQDSEGYRFSNGEELSVEFMSVKSNWAPESISELEDRILNRNYTFNSSSFNPIPSDSSSFNPLYRRPYQLANYKAKLEQEAKEQLLSQFKSYPNPSNVDNITTPYGPPSPTYGNSKRKVGEREKRRAPTNGTVIISSSTGNEFTYSIVDGVRPIFKINSWPDVTNDGAVSSFLSTFKVSIDDSIYNKYRDLVIDLTNSDVESPDFCLQASVLTLLIPNFDIQSFNVYSPFDANFNLNQTLFDSIDPLNLTFKEPAAWNFEESSKVVLSLVGFSGNFTPQYYKDCSKFFIRYVYALQSQSKDYFGFNNIDLLVSHFGASFFITKLSRYSEASKTKTVYVGGLPNAKPYVLNNGMGRYSYSDLTNSQSDPFPTSADVVFSVTQLFVKTDSDGGLPVMFQMSGPIIDSVVGWNQIETLSGLYSSFTNDKGLPNVLLPPVTTESSSTSGLNSTSTSSSTSVQKSTNQNFQISNTSALKCWGMLTLSCLLSFMFVL